MNRIRTFLAAALCALPVAHAHAGLSVFACEPEWGSLVSELAGGRAKVFVASTGLQDPHHLQARPSLIAAARNSDLVVCSGAELEIGWLPPVLAQSGNERIQKGRPDHIEVADHVTLIERPAVVDRSLGDLHPMGNPHVVYDPRNVLKAAEVIEKRLEADDASGAADYKSRLEAFRGRWQAAIVRWEQEAAPLKGVPVIEHHKEVSYLFHWLGMPVVGSLEPKPGVEPTSGHLKELLEQQAGSPARLIVRVSYRSPDASEWLASRARIPAIEVAGTVGGTPGAKDLFALYDDTLRRMLGVLKADGAAAR
jgi:zinc/manganese transport system substrate-binding protein